MAILRMPRPCRLARVPLLVGVGALAIGAHFAATSRQHEDETPKRCSRGFHRGAGRSRAMTGRIWEIGLTVVGIVKIPLGVYRIAAGKL